MDRIGFIGAGNMAEALIKGILATKVYPRENIQASDVKSEKLSFIAEQFGVNTNDDNKKLASEVDILVLSVKPQNMAEVLESIKNSIMPETLIISIAAGIKLAKIEAVLGKVPAIRVMPNTPALVGEGVAALFANDLAKPMLRKAEKIFSAVGEVVIIEDEDLMDAVTAVSGSGPAYFFLLMEDMIKAATKLGLSEDIAKKLVLQTAKGAALLAVEADNRNESPGLLRQKVTSPGGTTEAALKIFAEAKFGSIVSTAITAARNRGRELSK